MIHTLLVPDKFVVVTFDKDILINRWNGKYSWKYIIYNRGILITINVIPKFAKLYILF